MLLNESKYNEAYELCDRLIYRDCIQQRRLFKIINAYTNYWYKITQKKLFEEPFSTTDSTPQSTIDFIEEQLIFNDYSRVLY